MNKAIVFRIHLCGKDVWQLFFGGRIVAADFPNKEEAQYFVEKYLTMGNTVDEQIAC